MYDRGSSLKPLFVYKLFWYHNFTQLFFLTFRFCCSEQRRAERVLAGRHGQGRQEEAHAAHVQRTADLRAGEDLRADQVPGRARARQAGVRARHDRVASQG